VPVAREHWGNVRPRSGTPVHVSAFPQGGNGGKILRSALMIAVMAAAIYVTGPAGAAWASNTFGVSAAAGGYIAGALGAGVMMLGTLAVTPLIPPPEVKL
jgi:hypothetical protein